MSKKRVVITGLGAVSPFGAGVDKLWTNLIEGNSGISSIEYFDATGHASRIAGEIKKHVLNVTDYIEPKAAKRLDKFSQWALIAGEEAVKDAGLENIEELGIDPYKVGVIISAAAGGYHSFEEQHMNIIRRGPTKCSPYTIPMIIVNMPSGHLSIKYGYKGISKSVTSACASGSHSIGDAFRSIQYGDADIMVAGGTESVICHIAMAAFAVARTLSRRNDEPQRASRPYDKDRDGFVMAEGAGVLVLEEYEHAKARGAKIYGEISGYAQTSDAYDIVAPDPEGKGAIMSMRMAIKEANLLPADVDYVNSHGTSTGLGDIAESQAIATVLGDLSVNQNLKVSSTKSMLGHSLGASGALESIVCLKVITEGVIPPTINLENQDERVANLNYVPNKAIKADVKVALNNSFGFGGQNATVVFKKFN